MKGIRHKDEEPRKDDREAPIEIAIVGELTDNESDILENLLEVEPQGECTIYINCEGGSVYSALSIVSLIRLRDIRARGVVLSDCSSAALWIFAACKKRFVTPYTTALFHPMKWQSEERSLVIEAEEWAKHFGALERDMDGLLAQLFGAQEELIRKWSHPGRYVTGREMAEAGLAELIDLAPFPELFWDKPEEQGGK